MQLYFCLIHDFNPIWIRRTSFFRVLRDIDVDVGLVGCIQMLKITIADVVKEYNLVYPESPDIVMAKDLGEILFLYCMHFALDCLAHVTNDL